MSANRSLSDVLDAAEKAELARVLPVGSANNADSRELAERVRAVVEKDLLITDDAVPKWRELESVRRFRMMSEMVWRITCVFDASATAVEGMTKFNLGYNFSLARIVEAGRESFVVQC